MGKKSIDGIAKGFEKRENEREGARGRGPNAPSGEIDRAAGGLSGGKNTGGPISVNEHTGPITGWNTIHMPPPPPPMVR